MFCATKTSKADAVAEFVEREMLDPLGPPKNIVSDNEVCFTDASVSHFMEVHGVEWKTVAGYPPMSNGRAERMVVTVKKSIRKTLSNVDLNWVQSVPQIRIGYRLRRI